MKTFKTAVAFLLVAVPWLMSHAVQAADVAVGVEVSSVDDFYAPLATEGYWVEVGSYGRCWHPSYVASYWRPYCEGEWVWTDDGWYWQSDEPWGWATYHYGRWALDPYYGWVWVPDTVWGPSWVCFREGGGYCGWAPLPPGARFGGRSEITIGVGFVPDDWFVFVGERHFGERHHHRDVIIHNTKIINRTVIHTTIKREGNRVINEGPRVQDLQRINHEQIKKSTVTELRQQERVPPTIRKAAPNRPAILQQNERQIEQPRKEIQQRDRPNNNPPEIIRGTPNTPPAQAPSVEKQERQKPQIEHREPPPPSEHRNVEPHPNAAPPEHKAQQIEQHSSAPPPSGPPHSEKAAPAPQPNRQSPPPQEDGGERGGRGGQGEQGGRNR